VDPYPLPAIRRTPRVDYAMYACIRETGGGFFAVVCEQEYRPLVFRDPPPPLIFSRHLGE
jgi:hypothetical protein